VVLRLIYNNGEPTLGATQPERLNTINHRLDRFCIEGGVSNRLDQLEMKNLSSDGPATYAGLCGPTVKAANTRHAVPFLKDLANRHLTSNVDADHAIIHQLFSHTMEFHRLSYSSGTFFTGSIRRSRQGHGQVHTAAAEEGEDGEAVAVAHNTQNPLHAAFPPRGTTHFTSGCPMLHRRVVHWEDCTNMGQLEKRPIR